MKRKSCIAAIVFALGIVLLGGGEARAQQRKSTGISDEFPSIMRAVRPLGMGNAFLAMPGTDAIAQFYNPAAINDFEKERRYSVVAPVADFTPTFFGITSDLLDLRHELKSAQSASEKIRYFDSFTQRNTGAYDSFTTGMALFHVRHKRYAVGLVVDGRAVISLRNQAFPNFDFKTYNTAGVVGGSAIGLFDDTLQIGANLKLLYRMGIEDQITTSDILVYSIKQLIGVGAWNKGFGVGADVGIKYRLPFMKDSLAPTIAVAVQDIAGTRFTGSVHQMPMSVSVGVGVFPRIGSGRFALLVDFREINRDINLLTKFHAGVEARLPKIGKTEIAVRAGCNQGYFAGGLTMGWGLFSIDFAGYGEEAGRYTYSRGDYRVATSMAFQW